MISKKQLDNLGDVIAEASGHQAACRALSALKSMGFAVIPKAPTDGLLSSMAMRHRHDFLLDKVPGSISSGVTPAEREQILNTMRNVHDEVVGEGFYNPIYSSRRRY